jgi:hypothetical protein
LLEVDKIIIDAIIAIAAFVVSDQIKSASDSKDYIRMAKKLIYE